MEEQRQRQEDEQRRALAESDPSAGAAVTSTGGTTASATVEPNSEEAMLQRALALSTETPVKRPRVRTMFCFLFKKKNKETSIYILTHFLSINFTNTCPFALYITQRNTLPIWLIFVCSGMNHRIRMKVCPILPIWPKKSKLHSLCKCQCKIMVGINSFIVFLIC